MGRIPNIVIRNLCIAGLCCGILGYDAVAVAGAQSAAQSYPMVSLQTELARDADTFDDDKALVKSCSSEGQAQSTCLCVTHILKYELTLNEYRAAVRLYGKTKDVETIAAALRETGVEPVDIAMAQDVIGGLTTTPDFAERCSEAKAYYRPKTR